MALFEKQIKTIQTQLSRLETSQRVALGLCVVVIAGSILWLTQWSVRSETVPLFTDTLSQDQLGEMASQLQMLGEKYEERQGKIYVKLEDRRRLIWLMSERNLGPKTNYLTFSDLIEKHDVFASQEVTRWQQNVALQNELAAVIGTSSKVKKANVFIGTPSKVKLGGPSSPPTATVQVHLASGVKIDTSMVKGIADMVARAVPQLESQNVTIVDMDSLRSYSPSNTQDEYGTQLYDLQRQKEKELQTRVADHLSYIPGVIATVTVKLDEELINKTETKLDKPNVKRDVSEEETTSGASTTEEPGAAPNMGMSIKGGSSGSSHDRNKTETEYSEQSGSTVTTTQKKPGTILDAAASILIPRSYFVAIVKSESQDPNAEPAKEQVEEVMDRENKKIAASVTPILAAAAHNKPAVEVTTYSDAPVVYAATPSGGTSPIAQAGNVMELMSSHVKEIGLAVLALMALGMMMHIIRKVPDSLAVPKPFAMDQEQFALGPGGELMVDGGPVGKAVTPDALLVAHEADEQSVKARHIAREVNDMIESDPQAAAEIVRRWIEKDRT